MKFRDVIVMTNELVERLSKQDNNVTIGERGDTYDEIKERILDGFFHIKFTDTKGGTEIGINIDLEKTNIYDIDIQKGMLHI